MKTKEGTLIPPDVMADAQLVAECVAAGTPVPADVARRVRERAATVRDAILHTQGVRDLGVQLIREAHGAHDEDQERELTLAQRDLLKRGPLRLTDPDTGTVYMLVTEDDYAWLRSGR